MLLTTAIDCACALLVLTAYTPCLTIIIHKIIESKIIIIIIKLSQVQLLAVVPTTVKAVALYGLVKYHVLALSHESLTAQSLPPFDLIISMMLECSACLVIIPTLNTTFYFG